MTKLRFVVLAVLMTTIGLAFPSKFYAQSKSTTASLSGTVTDPSGARVANATVKVTNPENGIVRTGTTTSAGEFSFALLLEGTYTLEVSAPGFKTTRQDGIVLTPGDTVAENVTLTIGNTEQVQVNATGPLLQTQDANISTELENKQIEELPLNLRNVLSFATLDSAVNTQGDRQLLAAGGSEDTADQDYSFMNFGGGYFGNNLYLLEGGYDVAQGWGGILYVPAPEDTDEVKVTSYSFSAQYGLEHRQRDQPYHQGRHPRLPFRCGRIHTQPETGRQPLLQQSERHSQAERPSQSVRIRRRRAVVYPGHL